MPEMENNRATAARTRGRLTQAKINKLNTPGRYSDGQGRYLQVSNVSGRVTKAWLFKFLSPQSHPSGPRFDRNGKLKPWVREMGFGGIDLHDLETFRRMALQAKALVYQHIDPIEHRRTQRATVKADSIKAVTFAQCAGECIKGLDKTWKDGSRSREHWEQSLTDYVLPVIGQLPVALVEKSYVLAVLKPHWESKTVTMERIRGRIEVILDWAKGHGLRSGDNPASWKGNLDAVLARPSKLKKVTHFTALPYTDVPAFMAKLRAVDSIAACVIEFLILTAARWSEASRATWDEIDLDAAVWVIPAERIKANREHRVPLVSRAIEILKGIPRAVDSPFAFPSKLSWRRPVSSFAALQLLHQLAGEITLHGFRSTFRDWAGDCTNVAREVVEAALAHRIGDDTETAYRRSDARSKRRALMAEWETFCSGGQILELKHTA
jgi:integrase